jgi:hypothetical protein
MHLARIRIVGPTTTGVQAAALKYVDKTSGNNSTLIVVYTILKTVSLAVFIK